MILKPNSLSQGTLVTKVHSKTEYYKVAKRILTKSHVMLVQRFYEGSDYRIVVLDDEVISAYERIPLFVVGDNRSTIQQLLERKQRVFKRRGRDTEIDFDDIRIVEKLKRQRLTWKSVPPTNQKIYILDNANLSNGGEAIDYTGEIHPDFKRLSVGITKDLGLRMCGVDIITTGSITMPLKNYVVIEVNSAPGLDNHASLGLAQEEWDALYLRVLKSLESS